MIRPLFVTKLVTQGLYVHHHGSFYVLAPCNSDAGSDAGECPPSPISLHIHYLALVNVISDIWNTKRQSLALLPFICSYTCTSGSSRFINDIGAGTWLPL